jgi:hypothetical protein
MNNTVKDALLFAGLMLFAGSISALNVDGFGRRVLKPGEEILAQDARLPARSFSQPRGYIDADRLGI